MQLLTLPNCQGAAESAPGLRGPFQARYLARLVAVSRCSDYGSVSGEEYHKGHPAHCQLGPTFFVEPVETDTVSQPRQASDRWR